MRTRMYGGVGTGGENPLVTRLARLAIKCLKKHLKQRSFLELAPPGLDYNMIVLIRITPYYPPPLNFNTLVLNLKI